MCEIKGTCIVCKEPVYDWEEYYAIEDSVFHYDCRHDFITSVIGARYCEGDED